METETRRFVIEVSARADMARSSADDSEAADELLEALTAAKLPSWVFSVDGVEPQ